MTPEESEEVNSTAVSAASPAHAAVAEGAAETRSDPAAVSEDQSLEDPDSSDSIPPRKLVPPPKPSRPANEIEARPTAPRAPMIVVGEPGQAVAGQAVEREGAQAWNRPPNEPGGRPTLPWGNLAPRREPTPSVGVLRARLEAREKSNPPRTGSAVSPVPSKPGGPPPALHTSLAPNSSVDPVELALNALGPMPDSTEEPGAVLVTPLPHVPSHQRPEFVASALGGSGGDEGDEAAALAEAELDNPAETPTVESSSPALDASTPDSDAPTPSPGDAAARSTDFTNRPKAEPARRRSGPPRPRASSSPSLDVPPAPKVPSFSVSGSIAHVTTPVIPGEVPDRRSEPPVAPRAIAVMKIIAVGEPIRERTVVEEEVPTPRVPSLAVAPDALPVAPEELEELPAEEVAPDSGERRTPIPELSLDDAIPVVDDLESLGDAQAKEEAPSVRDVDARPPPPPRRLPKAPTLADAKKKRSWWEEIFGEEFVRANFRPTERQVQREVDFIEEALGVASGGVVLDLGCGSGNHAVELASRGYGVVGYDLSLYQLGLAGEIARQRSQRVDFVQGDMRELEYEATFDGVYCWNTSFGYFEEDKNLLVAERVFNALRPGGMFLIDVVNRDFAAVQSPCSLWYEGDHCVCMDDMSLDFITSRLRVKRSVILDDGRTRECVYSIRVYSMHELGKLLHDVGFRVTEASGHPSTPGVFFGEHSPRIIMLAQKP